MISSYCRELAGLGLEARRKGVVCLGWEGSCEKELLFRSTKTVLVEAALNFF